MKQPLVSIGMPTNRPHYIERALKTIVNQTYKNLEIIVSDNSTGDITKNIVMGFKDPRIKYTKQKKNIGMALNFQYVFNNSTGKYYTWVADDDKYNSNFVERCVNILENEPKIAAASMEVQYFCGNKLLDFFPEAPIFYTFKSDNVFERLYNIINHFYYARNLIYSLFRKEALSNFKYFSGGTLPFAEGPNELPIYLFVVEHGDFRVMPEVGMQKLIEKITYNQARWKVDGGIMPNKNVNLEFLKQRHDDIILQIVNAIDILNITKEEKKILKKQTVKNVAEHFKFFKDGKKEKGIGFK